MYVWAQGKQDVIQSDLPWVFFEGDSSVEDELPWQKY